MNNLDFSGTIQKPKVVNHESDHSTVLKTQLNLMFSYTFNENFKMSFYKNNLLQHMQFQACTSE